MKAGKMNYALELPPVRVLRKWPGTLQEQGVFEEAAEGMGGGEKQ
jgi:hypothetical protein